MFSPDKRQVVSVGDGYGILVWDVHVDATEDLSEYVDRLIDERTHAEQQRIEEQAEGAETPPPRLPILAKSQAVSEMIDNFRQRLRADDLESEEMFEGFTGLLGREPSPLVRVRERAMGLDLSLSPTQASQTVQTDHHHDQLLQADRSTVNAQANNALSTHQSALPVPVLIKSAVYRLLYQFVLYFL
jgi:hypothetical protein